MPQGQYADVDRSAAPERRRARRHRPLDGRVLGRHDGIIHYTVGQRRGIGVAVGEPLYVVQLDAERAPRHRRPARGAATRASSCATSTGWATGDSPIAGDGRGCSPRCARRGRRCRPGFAIADGHAAEVDLVDGEAGVAPGRRASSTTGEGRRACSAAASSSAGAAELASGVGHEQRHTQRWRRSAEPRDTEDSRLRPGRPPRQRSGRSRLCALGADLRLVFGAVFAARPAGDAVAERTSGPPGGASSRSASAPAFRCRLRRATGVAGIDLSAPMLRTAQEARRRRTASPMSMRSR